MRRAILRKGLHVAWIQIVSRDGFWCGEKELRARSSSDPKESCLSSWSVGNSEGRDGAAGGDSLSQDKGAQRHRTTTIPLSWKFPPEQ